MNLTLNCNIEYNVKTYGLKLQCMKLTVHITEALKVYNKKVFVKSGLQMCNTYSKYCILTY